MAVIKIEAKKDTRCMQTICLIRGDRRTQILRFGVNRFDGGVDLSDLAWVIKTANAKGIEDVFEPEAVEIGENRITVDWLVDGSVTDADGMAKYELNGLDATEDGKGIVWKGGMGTMSLRADIGENFADIDMTNIDRLVLYVEGRLQHIIDLTDELQNAGETANAAATAANAGAVRAEAAAIAANTGATAATEAASNASAAAEAANTAALPHAQLYGMRVRGETAKASGNPVTFLPDAGSLLQPVTVLEPQQQGSGEPSPSNIRSIISCDKLELGTRGKNIFPAWAESSLTMNGITFTKQADGSIRAQGTPTAYAYITLTDYKTLRKHGFAEGVHTISGLPVESDAWFVDLIGDANSPNINFYRNSAFNVSAELSRGGTYAWRIVITPNAGMIDLTFRIQVEAGSTPSSFAPCQSKIHTVQIGQTVCGFRYEWLTGKGVIEWALATLTGDETDWALSTAGNFYSYNVVRNLGSDEGYCSHYKTTNDLGSTDAAIAFYAGDTAAIRDSRFASVADWKAFLTAQNAAGTPVQITYKLANPIEIQLAPHIISATDPEQTNTLYGDGRIDVEYVKPLHVSIEERVAAALAAAKE